MNTYQIDTQVQLSAVFTNASGTPVDPTDVVLYLMPPGQVVEQFTYSGGQITKTATGNYAYTMETTAPGQWLYKWQGTGTVEVTSPDYVMNVQASQLIA